MLVSLVNILAAFVAPGSASLLVNGRNNPVAGSRTWYLPLRQAQGWLFSGYRPGSAPTQPLAAAAWSCWVATAGIPPRHLPLPVISPFFTGGQRGLGTAVSFLRQRMGQRINGWGHGRHPCTCSPPHRRDTAVTPRRDC
ncbi:MAG TPA: hypothetical protein PLD25_12865 [Chloroflexota bacterium]|nr:hypothetical protein [Chloroflexota bacterium]